MLLAVPRHMHKVSEWHCAAAVGFIYLDIHDIDKPISLCWVF